MTKRFEFVGLLQMSKTVTVGCFSGFWGDSMWGAAQLVHGETKLDYLVGDYLAEVTMGILAKARDKAAGGAGKGGFVQEFCDRVWAPLGQTLLANGTRVVTNAGGMNPVGLKEALEKVAAAKGWTNVVVAAVFGDDVSHSLAALRPHLSPFPGDEASASSSTVAPASANVYFGARGIAEALARGAHVVVTGRVVDSALVLGPLAHEFGWNWQRDWDLLARGSVVGHVLECGCQATGGNLTDWAATPSWVNVGFPIAVCSADGSAVVTKNPGTGGAVTVNSVTEQLLYEIGDPAAYVLPDVVVDFTTVTVDAAGPDRVRVAGASGRPAPSHFKVCVTEPRGFMLAALLLVPGSECRAKALRVGRAVLDNANAGLSRLGLEPITEFALDVIGGTAPAGNYDECVLRLCFAHDQMRALQVAGLEIPAAALATAPGLSGVGSTGRSAPSRRMHHYSLLLDRRAVANAHSVMVGRSPVTVIPDVAAAAAAVSSSSSRPQQSAALVPYAAPVGMVLSVPLWRAAYARSGDKGDAANVGVVARSSALYPVLLAQLTPEAVRTYLESLGMRMTRVDRFELPLLHAVNFLLHGVLGGGGASSLLYDKQGKTFAQRLLSMTLSVPASVPLPPSAARL